VQVRERWLAGSVRTSRVAAIAVAMLLCWPCLGCQRSPPMPKSSPGIECRISFPEGEGGAFAAVCLDDPAVIDNLVLQPINNANRDPVTADYAVMGTLTVAWSDGSRETLVLYGPWGHYSRGDEDYVTDFSKLQAACEAALDCAQGIVDSAREFAEEEGGRPQE